MEILKEYKTFAGLLALSIFFFACKGVRYLLIESYVPILLFSFISFGLIIALYKSDNYGKIAVRAWSVFLILWSLIRLILPLLFYVTPHITESHIREQFTPFEFLISLSFLMMGGYFWRYRPINSLYGVT